MEIRDSAPSMKGPADWFTGDVVWSPAEEWHWHGATPDRTMTHLSITDGRATWGDHVTDDEYGANETSWA